MGFSCSPGAAGTPLLAVPSGSEPLGEVAMLSCDSAGCRGLRGQQVIAGVATAVCWDSGINGECLMGFLYTLWFWINPVLLQDCASPL